MDKLLVIEDSFDVRMGLQAVLMGEGHRVEAVATGEQGLELFPTFQPDLVLLDLGLPGISGLEVCEQMRKISAVPIIVFSAVMETAEKIKALRQGANDYVVKGTEVGELLSRVTTHLKWYKDRISNPVNGQQNLRWEQA
jgi:two-component system KDP operon response regulator KdpE